MFTKTGAAFRLSVERLERSCPRLYFWTFTFVKVENDDAAMYFWKRFLCDGLLKIWPDCRGLRVVQVHPGGHGLHFHALLNKRLPVQIVRRLAARYHFGRIHVRRAREGDGAYLARYLSRSAGGIGKGARKWAAVGGFRACRVRDIEPSSRFHAAVKIYGGGKKLAFKEVMRIYSATMTGVTTASHGDKPKLTYVKTATNRIATYSVNKPIGSPNGE